MKHFEEILARDIMQSDVVTFSPSTPLEQALATFEDLHISGAPVVDAYGRIVGMLSAFDVAKPEHFNAGRLEGPNENYAMSEVDEEESVEEGPDLAPYSMEDFNPGSSERGVVADWMSRDVQCVGPEWTLPRISRLMVKEHIHRVPVVEEHRLKGIITTLDIVRCVAGKVPQRSAK
jgi:CBS domain-containing protein